MRASAPAAVLLPAIRAIVARVDPQQPISNVRSLSAIVADQTAPRLVQARVLGALAAVALLLAGVGIHGLLAFTVSQRMHEIGVRMALGAGPREVVAMVAGQGMRLALAGVVPGLVLAYVAARGLEALLASVHPGDHATFLGVIALCLAMVAAGSFFPARRAVRAVRADPVAAIRGEAG